MTETLWHLLLIPAGFVAGIINVLAGGGSFITLPALILAGLPVHIANGTNRIAVGLQAILATAAYQRRGQFDAALYKKLLAPMLTGALGGAYLATVIDPERLRRVFGALFLIMAATLIVRGSLKDSSTKSSSTTKNGSSTKNGAEPKTTQLSPLFQNRALRFVTFFLIGGYAGFIQAGAGLWILLSATSFYGVDALGANTVKLPIILTLTLPAIVIFLMADQVAWIPGLYLGFGTTLGTFVGVRWSLKGGATLILRAVTAVLLVTGISLLL